MNNLLEPLKKARFSELAIFSALAFALVACSDEDDNFSYDNHQLFHVASLTAKSDQHPFYWITDSLNKWNLFKENINHFEHQEGYEYILDVVCHNGSFYLDHIVEKREAMSNVPIFYYCDEHIQLSNNEFDYLQTDSLISLENGYVFPAYNDSVFIVQGDMLFTRNDFFDRFSCSRNLTRGAISSNMSKRWPKNVVYYSFDPNFYYQSIVFEAMSEIEAATNIKFVQRTTQNNYIKFTPSSSNSSMVGMRGGMQLIYLSPLAIKGNAIHEICHSLGMIHEQSRPDRDNYVVIYWNNIIDGYQNNFELTSSSDFDTVGEFDFTSIMLYPSNAFAKYNTYTIKTVDNAVFDAQRIRLSEGDIQTLEYGYPPVALIESNDNIILEYQEFLDDFLVWDTEYYAHIYNNAIDKTEMSFSEAKNITIRKTRNYYNPIRNRIELEIEDSTIVVPPGVSRIYLGAVHNVEKYRQSNPIDVDVTIYSIP